MAPQNLSTEQWEVTVEMIKNKESIYIFSFEDMIKNPDPRVKWAMNIMDQEGEVWTLKSEMGVFRWDWNYVPV